MYKLKIKLFEYSLRFAIAIAACALGTYPAFALDFVKVGDAATEINASELYRTFDSSRLEKVKEAMSEPIDDVCWGFSNQCNRLASFVFESAYVKWSSDLFRFGKVENEPHIKLLRDIVCQESPKNDDYCARETRLLIINLYNTVLFLRIKEMDAKKDEASSGPKINQPQNSPQPTTQPNVMPQPKGPEVFLCYSNPGNNQGCTSRDVRLCNSTNQIKTVKVAWARGLTGDYSSPDTYSVPAGAGNSTGPKIGESAFMDNGICRDYRYSISQ